LEKKFLKTVEERGGWFFRDEKTLDDIFNTYDVLKRRKAMEEKKIKNARNKKQETKKQKIKRYRNLRSIPEQRDSTGIEPNVFKPVRIKLKCSGNGRNRDRNDRRTGRFFSGTDKQIQKDGFSEVFKSKA
jgi:hypothetical protein